MTMTRFMALLLARADVGPARFVVGCTYRGQPLNSSAAGRYRQTDARQPRQAATATGYGGEREHHRRRGLRRRRPLPARAGGALLPDARLGGGRRGRRPGGAGPGVEGPRPLRRGTRVAAD